MYSQMEVGHHFCRSLLIVSHMAIIANPVAMIMVDYSNSISKFVFYFVSIEWKKNAWLVVSTVALLSHGHPRNTS